MDMATDYKEQRRMLHKLTEGGGYGVLILCQKKGDVMFATSPVPRLRGYEIVCASSDRSYDIWRAGKIKQAGLTCKQVKAWIRKGTPKWLYDDSEVTMQQKQTCKKWMKEFESLYPSGTIVW